MAPLGFLRRQLSSRISSPPLMRTWKTALGSRRWLLTVPLWASGLAVLLNDHFAEVLSIEGRSMAPTLSPHYHETGKSDYVLFRKYSPASNLKHGDVVAYFAPYNPERLVVKRIVGMEGDLVWLDGRRFEVANPPAGSRDASVNRTHDGEVERLEHEGMRLLALQWGDPSAGFDRSPPGAVRVPPGHLWVEGDNWRESGDSNYYGPICRGLVVGKAVCVISPLSRCGLRPWEDSPRDEQGSDHSSHGRAGKSRGGTRVEVAGWGSLL